MIAIKRLVYFDDENAFNYYMNIYNDFKQNNSEIVNENAWEITYEDTQMLENLPICIKLNKIANISIQQLARQLLIKTAEYISDIERLDGGL